MTYPKSRFSIRTLRVETEIMEEDEGDPRGFDISLDDEAEGLILMRCLIHPDRNISFFVEQWPAIRSAVDLIAECAPTHDEVMGATHEDHPDISGMMNQLDAFSESLLRHRDAISRALAAWDTTTNSKSHDGRLWQCMEELRREIANGESGDAAK